MIRFYRNRARGRCSRRGQALVLGALSVLILAVALFMTLGISWSVREKIRVQNAADAQAYSQAVKVARAFNYFAYSNRAMAGALVSMTMMHAYHSEISAGNDLFFGVFLAMMEMSGCEFAKCCSCPWGACCKFNHCVHGFKDIADAMKALSAWGKEARDIKAMEGPFRTALDSLRLMVQMIQGTQTAIRMSLMLSMFAGQAVPQLKEYNIPAGSDAPGSMLGILNWSQVSAAIDSGSPSSGRSKKRRDITEIVNSARPTWARNRYAGPQSSVALLPMTQKVKDKVGGSWLIAQAPFVGGGGGLLSSKPSNFLTSILLWGKPAPNIEGKFFFSTDNWTLTGKKHCCGGVAAMPFILSLVMPSVLATGQNGGEHKPTMIKSPHSGQHRIDMNGLFGFTTFNPSGSGRFNQPVLFGSARQNLSLNENGARLPWDITSTGVASAELTQQGSVQMANTRESRSISKAVVYYHHPGNWKEPPNFFNPFWRAKLHPFSSTEAMMVAGAVGDSAGAAAALMGVGTASGDQAMSAF